MIRVRRTARLLVVAVLAAALSTPASAGAVSYYNVAAVSFGGSTGYIAGGYSPTGVANGFVSRTTDGGATWRATPVSGAVLKGVKASSDGARATTVNGLPDFDWMRQTVNSGVSWDWVDPVPSYSAGINDAAYTASGRRIIVGKLLNGYALIASSPGDNDPGEDWSGPVPVPSGDDEPPPTKAWLTAVDVAPDGETVWAAGNDWTDGTLNVLLKKSTDGGSTWTTPTASGATDGQVTDIAAPSVDTAYLTQRNGYLKRTFNGGAAFDSDSIASGFYVNAIDAYDTSKVVVVGDAGKVYYSANANAAPAVSSWVSKATGTTNNLNGVQMLDADSWIVVGDNETILRTDNAGATWTGSRTLAIPAVTITAPASGFTVGSTTVSISGTASDAGVGVERAQFSLQRGANQFWDGSNWTATQTWHDATSADGWETWSATQSIDATEGGLVMWARSRDGMGQYSTSRSVASGGYTKAPSSVALAKTSIDGVGYGAKTTVSGWLRSGSTGLTPKTVQLKKGSTVLASTTTGGGGAFSFNFVPANVATTYALVYPGDDAYTSSSASVKITPKASIGRPVAPTAKRYRYFTTYAYLSPRHSSGAGGSRFYFYSYQKLSNGKYDYVYKKSASASTVNSSSYPTKSKVKARVKLPAGKWRVKVKHADSGHSAAESSYDYFKVQ